jgi:hypothetical protein
VSYITSFQLQILEWTINNDYRIWLGVINALVALLLLQSHPGPMWSCWQTAFVISGFLTIKFFMCKLNECCLPPKNGSFNSNLTMNIKVRSPSSAGIYPCPDPSWTFASHSEFQIRNTQSYTSERSIYTTHEHYL